jgi:AbrB family looped-hinge helix DNA binding protein
MITTVAQKNMITIPAEVGRRFGIKPGYRLDWQPVEGKDEILIRVIPDRGELARRLLGAGRRFSPERNAVAELIAERAEDWYASRIWELRQHPVNPTRCARF